MQIFVCAISWTTKGDSKPTGDLSDDQKSYNKKLKKEQELIAHG